MTFQLRKQNQENNRQNDRDWVDELVSKITAWLDKLTIPDNTDNPSGQ
jgi:hypothetical protein